MSAQIRYQYQASGFLRWTGLTDLSEVTQEDVDRFRLNHGELSPVTVENYIKAVTILTGQKFNGKKLRIPMKRPKIIPLEHLSKVYGIARDRGNSWMCRFLKFGYITGLRLGDLSNLHRDQIEDDAIVIESSKSHKLHVIPRHFILRCRLPDEDKPLYRNEKTVRKRIAYYCSAARVPYFTPHQIRKTSITQYELAQPGSGMIIHGEALSSITMKHYCDQYEVLKSAQERLQIPQSMLPKGERWKRQAAEKDLQNAYRRLSESDRETVLRMVRRLA